MILKEPNGGFNDMPPHLVTFSDNYPGLLETCRKIIRFAKVSSNRIDMGGNNIMFRKSNNVPVIIDPFYDIDSLKD